MREFTVPRRTIDKALRVGGPSRCSGVAPEPGHGPGDQDRAAQKHVRRRAAAQSPAPGRLARFGALIKGSKCKICKVLAKYDG